MNDCNVRRLPRIGIGEAAQLYGLTLRALRLYEERGLLWVGRDRLNCRYYDAESRRRLSWIAPLRAAGLSLADIREVLAAEDETGGGAGLALARLKTREDALQQQLERVARGVSEMERRTESTPMRQVRAG